MSTRKRQPLHDWKAKLTAKEARIVARLERVSIAGRQAAKELAPIRNRAIQRCLYEAQSSSPPAAQPLTQKEA